MNYHKHIFFLVLLLCMEQCDTRQRGSAQKTPALQQVHPTQNINPASSRIKRSSSTTSAKRRRTSAPVRRKRTSQKTTTAQSTTKTPTQKSSQVNSLSNYNYSSASVLPLCTYNNKTYAILGREALIILGNAGGKDKGTYDDWGGTRDAGETHPIITAARECFEEGNLDRALGMKLSNIRDYIDISKYDYTEHIIAYERSVKEKNVTYITNFDLYAQRFINNFYLALSQATDRHNLEKDRIALVDWQEMQDAILHQPQRGIPVTLNALVVDPHSHNFNSEQITLRPFLVAKLRLFILNKPYKQGLDTKIRFYAE